MYRSYAMYVWERERGEAQTNGEFHSVFTDFYSLCKVSCPRTTCDLLYSQSRWVYLHTQSKFYKILAGSHIVLWWFSEGTFLKYWEVFKAWSKNLRGRHLSNCLWVSQNFCDILTRSFSLFFSKSTFKQSIIKYYISKFKLMREYIWDCLHICCLSFTFCIDWLFSVLWVEQLNCFLNSINNSTPLH